MKTQIANHIERLRQRYGSYSEAARRIGIEPRSFRRGRNERMAKTTERCVIFAGKLLLLQNLLGVLVRSGDLKRDALKRAWREVTRG